MASYEFNDRLVLTELQGFPSELDLKKHRENPLAAEDFSGRTFGFYGKPGKRVYNHSPDTCFLIQDIRNHWLYWGKIIILEQTKMGREKTQATSGKFEITDIYDPMYQEIITRRESPSSRKSYFGEDEPIFFTLGLLDLFLKGLSRNPDPLLQQEMLRRAGYNLPSEEDLKA